MWLPWRVDTTNMHTPTKMKNETNKQTKWEFCSTDFLLQFASIWSLFYVLLIVVVVLFSIASEKRPKWEERIETEQPKNMQRREISWTSKNKNKKEENQVKLPDIFKDSNSNPKRKPICFLRLFCIRIYTVSNLSNECANLFGQCCSRSGKMDEQAYAHAQKNKSISINIASL